MIQKFNLLEKRNSIVLIKTETEISISQSEVGQLNDFVKVFEQVKCSLEALIRRNSTLLTAEKLA